MLYGFSDGTSLVAARPITGRTNQIRVHLQHLGLPVCGEQAYLPNHRLGETQTHQVGDAPLCLHALRISFLHPLTKERVTFECPAPAWSAGKAIVRPSSSVAAQRSASRASASSCSAKRVEGMRSRRRPQNSLILELVSKPAGTVPILRSPRSKMGLSRMALPERVTRCGRMI